jgi:hypothetical protein
MTAPEHLIISGPEDILGYIPHSLGYWPSQSLVAMTTQGKRLGATLRVDLPEGGGRRGRETFARAVAEYLLADKEADGTLLAFFADGGFGAGGMVAAPSYRPLLADLECALGLAGMPVRDAWHVGADYWRNVYCIDTSCCPLPGRPVAEIRNSRLNAEMVYLGSSVGAPPGAEAPASMAGAAADAAAVMAAEHRWTLSLAGLRTQRAQFEAVLDAWSAVLQAATPATVPPESGSLDAGPQNGGPVGAAPDNAGPLWGGPFSASPLNAGSVSADPDVAAPGGLEPDFAGFLRASLLVPAWRDAVLVMAAAGRAAAAAGAEAFGIFSAETELPASRPPLPVPQPSEPQPSGTQLAGPVLAEPLLDVNQQSERPFSKGASPAPDSPEHPAVPACALDALPGYGEVLLGLSPPVPDWDAMKRLEGLMRDLSACGGGEAQAAALTANGWIEWCRGRGSFAHASLTRALEASPGYRLAELLSEVVRRGTICGWAGRREAAWQRFGPDAA